jgi:hypothetical protein
MRRAASRTSPIAVLLRAAAVTVTAASLGLGLGCSDGATQASQDASTAETSTPDANEPDAPPSDAVGADAPLSADAADAADAGTSDAGGPTSLVPTPKSIAGKTVVGRIDLSGATGSGKTIENVHVVNHDGPCIVLNGVHDVTIVDSEIGPCGDASNQVGDVGIDILGGSTRITIRRNVIHDASNLISGDDVRGPVSVDRNLFYDIRGTSWAASAIQFGESRNHAGPIAITCNVIDDRLVEQYPMAGGRQRRSEDHISMYDSGGTAAYPLEIAYNRIRGALDGWGGISGSGMQLGDSPAGGGNPGSNTPGYIYAHHNVVYWTNGSGISFAGGTTGNRVEFNLVDNRGSGPGPSSTPGGAQVLGKGTSDTGWHYGLHKYDAASAMDISYQGNLGIAFLWAYDNDGHLGPTTANVFGAAGVVVHDLGGNDFQYTGFGTTLGVDTVWDRPTAAPCL